MVMVESISCEDGEPDGIIFNLIEDYQLSGVLESIIRVLVNDLKEDPQDFDEEIALLKKCHDKACEGESN